ncbi:MAG TPA: GxxExxY protein [Vicinamibacterales bacterium]|jgi:GxxExxY protein
MLIDSPYNHITSQIIGAAIEVHRTLGPGLLESAYVPCLKYELGLRHVTFAAEVAIPLSYKGVELGQGYRIDLIVEKLVVVEVKSVEVVLPVHKVQVMTYLKLTSCPVGLLINFDEARLIDGVHRVFNPSVFGETEGTE